MITHMEMDKQVYKTETKILLFHSLHAHPF